MTTAHSERILSFVEDRRWLTVSASLAVGSGFFALWFWLLPHWLGFDVELAGTARWRLLAAVPSRRLVVVGFFRYVRNPMYLGLSVGWIGLWVVFGHPDPRAIAAAAAVALGVHLFVLLYEEPTLRRKFGADYELYCQNVSRWLPRIKPWQKPMCGGPTSRNLQVK